MKRTNESIVVSGAGLGMEGRVDVGGECRSRGVVCWAGVAMGRMLEGTAMMLNIWADGVAEDEWTEDEQASSRDVVPDVADPNRAPGADVGQLK